MISNDDDGHDGRYCTWYRTMDFFLLIPIRYIPNTHVGTYKSVLFDVQFYKGIQTVKKKQIGILSFVGSRYVNIIKLYLCMVDLKNTREREKVC